MTKELKQPEVEVKSTEWIRNFGKSNNGLWVSYEDYEKLRKDLLNVARVGSKVTKENIKFLHESKHAHLCNVGKIKRLKEEIEQLRKEKEELRIGFKKVIINENPLPIIEEQIAFGFTKEEAIQNLKDSEKAMWIKDNGSKIIDSEGDLESSPLVEIEIKHHNKELKLSNKIVKGKMGEDGFYLIDGSELSHAWDIVAWRYINENTDLNKELSVLREKIEEFETSFKVKTENLLNGTESYYIQIPKKIWEKLSPETKVEE